MTSINSITSLTSSSPHGEVRRGLYLVLGTLFLIFFCIPCITFAQENADSVSLATPDSDAMPTNSTYTITLRNFQLSDTNSEAVIKIRVGSNHTGADLHITADKIFVQTPKATVILAEQMPDPLKPHDYTIGRLASLRICRDGVDHGNIATANYKGEDADARIVLRGANQVQNNYSYQLTSNERFVAPTQEPYETNIGNMLTDYGFTNLAPDPYLNTGFDRSGRDADKRTFTTANAKINGWGSDIWVETDAPYSGPMCIRLSGQSVYSESSCSGAALKQPVDFDANKPYVIRAMVNSNGWEGKLGIASESNFIHITDTRGEWKQIEAVLIPRMTWRADISETFYVHNADYQSDGTLLIDNIEIYEGYSNTNIGNATNVPAATIAAGDTWSPKQAVSIYRLGFTETDTQTFSQIDPKKVQITGAPFLTRTFEGSKLYAVYFPSAVTNVTATGEFFRDSYFQKHLYQGIDYLLMSINPKNGAAQYISDEVTDNIPAGTYIMQVADNYDNCPIRFDFLPAHADAEPAVTASANVLTIGNATGTVITPESAPAGYHYLFFNEELQQFDTKGSENSNAQAVRPFIPYLLTSLADLNTISFDPTVGIRRLNAAQSGERIMIRPVLGGIEMTSASNRRTAIYSISGQRIALPALEAGTNYISLPAGIYIVAGKKVVVR